jgi:hypothetical protein
LFLLIFFDQSPFRGTASFAAERHLRGIRNNQMTMLISSAAPNPRLRIAIDRHNLATGCHPAEGRNGTALRLSEGPTGESSQIPELPKAWATAGAFSLLTLAPKLAQY